eukprot:scaffold302634_cov30-Tisochrysis_lutea.AAC.1
MSFATCAEVFPTSWSPCSWQNSSRNASDTPKDVTGGISLRHLRGTETASSPGLASSRLSSTLSPFTKATCAPVPLRCALPGTPWMVTKSPETKARLSSGGAISTPSSASRSQKLEGLNSLLASLLESETVSMSVNV